MGTVNKYLMYISRKQTSAKASPHYVAAAFLHPRIIAGVSFNAILRLKEVYITQKKKKKMGAKTEYFIKWFLGEIHKRTHGCASLYTPMGVKVLVSIEHRCYSSKGVRCNE